MSYLNLMEGHIKVTLISRLNKNKEKKNLYREREIGSKNLRGLACLRYIHNKNREKIHQVI